LLVPQRWLTTDRQTIRLKQEDVWIDTRQFLALLAQHRSHQHPAGTLCPEYLSLLEYAIALYHVSHVYRISYRKGEFPTANE
jgi:hypothetical protein